ncbi:MAG: hypothetical protein IKA53_05935 [Clostridia bacterium]|nr:hypothetical protein [Clostridia bacterium]
MPKIFNFLNRLGRKGKIALSLVFGTVMALVMFYIFLPAINPCSAGFWIYLTAVLFFYLLPFLNPSFSPVVILGPKKAGDKPAKKQNAKLTFNKWVTLPLLVPIAVLILGFLISSEFFFARRYASVITVKEAEFSEDMPKTDMAAITNIALMDSDSAAILGTRTLGSLSHVVSQYTLNGYYTQINYHNTPKKVSNLEYDGFFKWLGNRKSGVPGFVMVDPVKSESQYEEFKTPIRYVESAYFGEDLQRKLRMSYPTKIFHSITFEVDEEGNPFYVVSCAKPRVFLFGAMDIAEVILFDPASGESKIMPVKDAPAWIDVVYTGDLATEKYNWKGAYAGGFLNSVIGNVGCTVATDDFGYLVRDDDVWYFTGVTSAVADDKSNIGFILSNARTGEYKFYPVVGAEEHSAMAAAEGEVQEKGYTASFPSLVNISGQATYICVLKDDAGLVKLYALVNVENYSIVATGATQTDAMSAYTKLLKQSNIDIGDMGAESATFTVTDVRIVPVSGVATVYITADDGKVYKGYLEADEALILVQKGDTLTVSFSRGEVENVLTILSWSFGE